MKKIDITYRDKVLKNGNFLEILQEIRNLNVSLSEEARNIDSPKEASSYFLLMLSRYFKNTNRDLFEFFQCHRNSPCRSCCFSGFKGEAFCNERTVCSQHDGFLHSVYFEAKPCPYFSKRKQFDSAGAFYRYSSSKNLEKIKNSINQPLA
jgi:hypothetical protein